MSCPFANGDTRQEEESPHSKSNSAFGQQNDFHESFVPEMPTFSRTATAPTVPTMYSPSAGRKRSLKKQLSVALPKRRSSLLRQESHRHATGRSASLAVASATNTCPFFTGASNVNAALMRKPVFSREPSMTSLRRRSSSVYILRPSASLNRLLSFKSSQDEFENNTSRRSIVEEDEESEELSLEFGSSNDEEDYLEQIDKQFSKLGFSTCPAEEADVTIEYSYDCPNEEFPHEVTEDDLFQHSTADGFCTREHGFLIPDYEAALQSLLNSRGRIWYTMGRRMRGLQTKNGLIKAVEEMEIVPGDSADCPDDALQIACSVLAFLTHGYRYACDRNNIAFKPAPALHIPWTKICMRLGRKDVYLGAEDLMYNVRPIRGNRFEFDNLEIISPIFGTSAESLMSKLFCESNRHLFKMQEAILALARGEWSKAHICTMIAEIKALTHTLAKGVPDDLASSSIDPVAFATAFANTTSPLKDDVPALSGAGCPVFCCMDLIIGRKQWNSVMGADVLLQAEWMPKNWRRFIEFLRQQRLFEKVPEEYQYLWDLLKESYCGERGWLGKHKYRAYQFVELAGALGRSTNKGSESAALTIDMLEASRQERDPGISSDRSSYKTCLFKGKIKAVTRISDDRISKLVTIESAKPLTFHIGDHIAVVMTNSDDAIWDFASQHPLDIDQLLSMENCTLNQEWKDRLDFDSLEYTVNNVLKCAKLSTRVAQLSLTNLCEVLSPEEPRLYSFATVQPADGCVTTFDLFVTKTGQGGCSAFLFQAEGSDVSFGISTAMNMLIPSEDTIPLVVIAAGSGIGTYLPLLVNESIRNPKYAFCAYRTEKTVPHLSTHLKQEVQYGRLKLFVELSRENFSLVTKDRMIRYRKNRPRYIDNLLEEEEDLIKDLAASVGDGGQQAIFYVCGNSDFFRTIRSALNRIDPDLVDTLVLNNRLHLEVQARGGIDGKQDTESIKLTEICFHNTMDDYWTIIHGKVYDLSDYLRWHPGGRKIIHYVGGTDCSEFWDLVSHNRDRMVYSQLKAYELGHYDSSDPHGIMKLLEFVTRCENSVNLYQEKSDLFDNLCDSYGKVQNLWEIVFGSELFELLMKLVTSKETVKRMFRRLWKVKHGADRMIANKLFSVTPVRDGPEDRKPQILPGASGVVLRPVLKEERSTLESRMKNSNLLFFRKCKNGIVDASNAIGNEESADHLDKLFTKMFYRLISCLEELYSSLAKPIPLTSIRCWNALRAEIMDRKTFMLRFRRPVQYAPDHFVELVSCGPPSNASHKKAYFDKVLEYLVVNNSLDFRFGMSSNSVLVDDWLDYPELHQAFRRLDKDSDGLVNRQEILSAAPMTTSEDMIIRQIRKRLEEDPNVETLNFQEFLYLHPELAEKKRNSDLQASAIYKWHASLSQLH